MIVRISARAARVVAKTNHLREGDVLEFSHAGQNDRGKYPQESFGAGTKAGLKDEWPGRPVPLGGCVPRDPDSFELEPLTEHVVRVRRLAFDEPREGIVIGHLVREEGKRYPGGTAPSQEPEFVEGYLDSHRRVPLLEVACPSERGPSTLFQVWADDAEPIDGSTLATPSLTRVYRLDVEYPAGSHDERGWPISGWEPDEWEPGEIRDAETGGWDYAPFRWPSVRLYLSQSSAKTRAEMLRKYGATVTVVPSERVVWR